MPDIVTTGWLTIDDIALPDGTYEQKVLGGGALYSAVGARIWAERVGIHSVTGEMYLQTVRDAIAAAGIDTAGVNAIPGRGLELWLLHESDDLKQQVPKLAAATAREMDDGRGPLPASYRSARGVHVAPQSPQGSFASLAKLADLVPRPVITLDILADAYVEATLYEDTAFLSDVTAFLPSREEVVRLWRPASLEGWIRQHADRYDRVLGVKLGGDGSLVCAGAGAPIQHVPAYPAAVLDTTGAGDSYCGGFLAGLVAGRPVPECAAMGTVSASFVVEARGALATRRPTLQERRERLEHTMRRIAVHA